jgi:anti-sigma B factor antagonist
MNLEIKKQEGEHGITLFLAGEVDVYTSLQLKKELTALIDRQVYEVILELSKVSYMDSTGLGVIIGGLKAARNHQGKIILLNPTPRLERLFSITGLSEVMEIKKEEGISDAKL